MANETLNNSAWEKLFTKYEILKRIEIDGAFHISAGQIKKFREPRLMVKFDHTVNLPRIFAKNDLAILPLTYSPCLKAGDSSLNNKRLSDHKSQYQVLLRLL